MKCTRIYNVCIYQTAPCTIVLMICLCSVVRWYCHQNGEKLWFTICRSLWLIPLPVVFSSVYVIFTALDGSWSRRETYKSQMMPKNNKREKGFQRVYGTRDDYIAIKNHIIFQNQWSLILCFRHISTRSFERSTKIFSGSSISWNFSRNLFQEWTILTY